MNGRVLLNSEGYPLLIDTYNPILYKVHIIYIINLWKCDFVPCINGKYKMKKMFISRNLHPNIVLKLIFPNTVLQFYATFISHNNH